MTFTPHQELLSAITKAMLDKWADMMPEPTGADVAVVYTTIGMLLLGQMPVPVALGLLATLGKQLIAESQPGPAGPMDIN